MAIFISIHAPTRGATTMTQQLRATRTFQSTLPREERPSWELYRTIGRTFQSTLPREERQVGWEVRRQNREFQSTLPREERRIQSQYKADGLGISIHAPTRGATSNWLGGESMHVISIHAPTRGATATLQSGT